MKKKNKAIIIVVGFSGSGKSTFINAMNLPSNNVYITSQPMISKLKKNKLAINHDTIFKLSQELYCKDPFWQVKLIEKTLKDKPFIIIDGPRRILEVEKIKKIFKNVIVIAIASSAKIRFNRLKKRKKIRSKNKKDFARLEDDEKAKMKTESLIKKADFIIQNDASNKISLQELQEKAKLIGLILKRIYK